MAKRVQRRRGTTSEHGNFTGFEGEITVDTTIDTLRVHDGSLAGGHALAKADASNLTLTNAIGIIQLNVTDGDETSGMTELQEISLTSSDNTTKKYVICDMLFLIFIFF